MIGSFFAGLFDGQYAPHGYCLLWQPGIVWTHAVSDALIALAYFSIPLALIRFVRRRPDVEFGGIIWLFAAFILACGTTHMLSIWTLWHGDYALEGLVKAVTAAVSVVTAIALWPLIPRAIALPSPLQLRHANDALAARIAERDAALAKLKDEIAHRERAEAALVQAQKIEAIGQLTGGIAHDFNNLLQAVAGNLDLIRLRAEDPEKVRRWADNAQQGVDRGTRLTGQLLAFSRTQQLELKKVDVAPLIAGMSELLTHSLGTEIALRTMLADVGGGVTADPTQLELAILNLAINARDAMPDGGTLTIATSRCTVSGDAELADGDYVEVAVSDTGVGMTAAVAARALEPFFTTKDVGRGTGLGLSMVHGIARQSGGTLRLRSAPGAGTTATIVLRFVDGGMEAPGDVAAIAAAMAGANLAAPIMVVDDDDDVRALLCDALEVLGYAPVAFADGPSALTAIDSVQPRLVLLDFAMPGMNGAEVAQRIRARFPDLAIIFASGYADRDALDAVIGNATDILRKPFTTAELANIIAGRLGGPSLAGAV
jgi:signal transduction histidine kinase/CheY-like chemotaxis protein